MLRKCHNSILFELVSLLYKSDVGIWSKLIWVSDCLKDVLERLPWRNTLTALSNGNRSFVLAIKGWKELRLSKHQTRLFCLFVFQHWLSKTGNCFFHYGRLSPAPTAATTPALLLPLCAASDTRASARLTSGLLWRTRLNKTLLAPLQIQFQRTPKPPLNFHVVLPYSEFH